MKGNFWLLWTSGGNKPVLGYLNRKTNTLECANKAINIVRDAWGLCFLT